MRHHQWSSHIGWCASWLIASQDEAVKSNSICSFENIIKRSLIMLGGGGRRLLHSMHTHSRWVGNGSPSNRSSRSQFHISGGLKFPPPLPLNGISSSTKLKHKKEVALLWSVIHKAIAVNERHGKISTDIDKNGPRCGSKSVELVEHRFFSCPLVEQGWRYVANIMWEPFAKRGNLGPRKLFYMMQCLFDQPLHKALNDLVKSCFS